jgi:uncharacterized membrane protein
MQFEESIEVSVPATTVFETYADVERWPSWTSSVTSVELLDRGPFRVGSRARVRQPRLPVAVWQVTELVPGRSFTWVARGPGVVTTASHTVTPVSDRAVRVAATLDQEGPLGPLVGLLTRRLTRRYMRTELEGLKAYCEA